ncbi:MAG: PspA/IM30 family protein [Alphaproteobacteria bacterium]|jgi:phage shock protein A|nr:PspA/IM30 family protein [Alphaproteobacteria bacterium]
MSILAKLATAMRGAATEAGEAVVDHQALRILDQEMRDAEKELSEAKSQLTQVMAQRTGVEREVNRLKSAIAEHEDYAAKALDKGDEALAGEVCERIAQFEEELGVQQQSLDHYENGVNQLKRSIKSTERNVAAMKRQVSMVKATEKVQRASEAASAKFSGSNAAMTSATSSLERIKKRQQERSDRMEAASQLAEETEGADLDKRLKDAGITKSGASGSDVMARIRAKSGGSA